MSSFSDKEIAAQRSKYVQHLLDFNAQASPLTKDQLRSKDNVEKIESNLFFLLDIAVLYDDSSNTDEIIGLTAVTLCRSRTVSVFLHDHEVKNGFMDLWKRFFYCIQVLRKSVDQRIVMIVVSDVDKTQTVLRVHSLFSSIVKTHSARPTLWQFALWSQCLLGWCQPKTYKTIEDVYRQTICSPVAELCVHLSRGDLHLDKTSNTGRTFLTSEIKKFHDIMNAHSHHTQVKGGLSGTVASLFASSQSGGKTSKPKENVGNKYLMSRCGIHLLYFWRILQMQALWTHLKIRGYRDPSLLIACVVLNIFLKTSVHEYTIQPPLITEMVAWLTQKIDPAIVMK